MDTAYLYQHLNEDRQKQLLDSMYGYFIEPPQNGDLSMVQQHQMEILNLLISTNHPLLITTYDKTSGFLEKIINNSLLKFTIEQLNKLEINYPDHPHIHSAFARISNEIETSFNNDSGKIYEAMRNDIYKPLAEKHRALYFASYPKHESIEKHETLYQLVKNKAFEDIENYFDEHKYYFINPTHKVCSSNDTKKDNGYNEYKCHNEQLAYLRNNIANTLFQYFLEDPHIDDSFTNFPPVFTFYEWSSLPHAFHTQYTNEHLEKLSQYNEHSEYKKYVSYLMGYNDWAFPNFYIGSFKELLKDNVDWEILFANETKENVPKSVVELLHSFYEDGNTMINTCVKEGIAVYDAHIMQKTLPRQTIKPMRTKI